MRVNIRLHPHESSMLSIVNIQCLFNCLNNLGDIDESIVRFTLKLFLLLEYYEEENYCSWS